MTNRMTKGNMSVGSIQPTGTVQGGAVGVVPARCKGFNTGTVTVVPGLIAASAAAVIAIAIAGVAPGDIVIFSPPAAFEAGLVLAQEVITAGIVTQTVANVTVAGVTGASRTWTYVWIDLT